MFIINPYRFTTTPSFTGLLDTYTGARVGYSLRLLTSSFSGQAPLRVSRNSATVVEADVYFDTNNLISLDSPVGNFSVTSATTTLGEFVAAPGYTNWDSLPSAVNATVTRFRNQVNPGVEDFIQTTPSLQPRLVNTGVLETNNGHVALYFNGAASNNMITTATSFNSNNNTMFLIARNTNAAVGTALFGFSTQSGLNTYTVFTSSSTATQNLLSSNTTGVTATVSASYNIEYSYYGRTRTDGYHEISVTPTTNTSVSSSVGVSSSTVPNYSSNAFQLGMRRYNTPAAYITGHITEAIIFNSDQSANRNGIQLNQITAF